jgi:hypothetical protein
MYVFTYYTYIHSYVLTHMFCKHILLVYLIDGPWHLPVKFTYIEMCTCKYQCMCVHIFMCACVQVQCLKYFMEPGNRGNYPELVCEREWEYHPLFQRKEIRFLLRRKVVSVFYLIKKLQYSAKCQIEPFSRFRKI